MSLLTLVLAGLMAACSSSSPQTSSLPSTDELNQQQEEKFRQTPKPPVVLWGEVDEKASAFDFECEDCPSSIGQMVSMTVDGSQPKPARNTNNCQGGLIAEDVFLTNRHCLPQDLLEKNKSCQNRIRIIFPKLGDSSKTEVVGCEQIVDFSMAFSENENDRQPDWALLKLSKALPHRVQEFTAEPIPDQTTYVSFAPVIDPKNKTFEMQSIRCVSRQNTLFLPSYNQDQSPIALFKCEKDMTKRFSGSLLFKQTQEGYIPVATLSHVWNTQINNEKILVSDQILASSISCLPLQGSIPEGCQFDPDQHDTQKQQVVINAILSQHPQIQAEVESYLSATHPIQWKVLTVAETETNQTTPQLLQTWQPLKDSDLGYIGLPAKTQFFETLAQISPVCLKAEFAPAADEDGNATFAIPIIELSVFKDNHNRVQAKHEVRHWKSSIAHDKDRAGHFVLVPSGSPPPYKQPQALLASRYNHLAASIPLCQ